MVAEAGLLSPHWRYITLQHEREAIIELLVLKLSNKTLKHKKNGERDRESETSKAVGGKNNKKSPIYVRIVDRNTLGSPPLLPALHPPS